MKEHRLRVVALAAAGALTLAACGGGNSASVLVTTTPLVAGPLCSAGGTLVSGGVDTNGDGTLQQSEVTQSGHICNGADGTMGAAGAAGATGAAGAAGAAGNNGIAALLKMTAEPAGANCAAGGMRVDAGPDGNANGTLEPGEITTTTYVCNGTQPVWIRVTGNSQATAANMAYIADSPSGVNFTLPSNPEVGNTLALSAAGAGGWRLDFGSDQTLLAAGGTQMLGPWTASSSGTSGWNPMASDYSGDTVYAADQVGIKVSTDGGVTWTTSLAGNENWRGLAVSAQGQYVIGVSCGTGADGKIRMSTNGGETWFEPAGAAALGGACWERVGMSDDGQRIVLARDFGSGSVYVSSDGGTSFSQVPGLQGGGSWVSASVSSDGMKMIASQNATVGFNQTVVSTDGGATWAAVSAPAGMHNSAVSADGSTFVGITHQGTDNSVYVSTDNGATWTKLGLSLATNGSQGNLLRVAVSGDGRTIAASTYSGKTWVSLDGGATWSPNPDTALWYGLAVSGNGSKVFIADTSNSRPIQIRTTSSNSLVGQRYSSVNLQYIGSRTWMVLGSSGSITPQSQSND